MHSMGFRVKRVKGSGTSRFQSFPIAFLHVHDGSFRFRRSGLEAFPAAGSDSSARP